MIKIVKFALAYCLTILVFFYLQYKGWVIDQDLAIYPRDQNHLLGIITAPLIHGDINHLISNVSVLFPLLGLLYFTSTKQAHSILWTIWIITGFLVWLFARPSYHLGASGIVYAIQSFLLVSGIIKRRAWLMATGAVSLMLFGGGYFFGLLPFQPGISWESHGLGALTGVLVAFMFKHKGIKPRAKRKKSQKQDNYLQFGTRSN